MLYVAHVHPRISLPQLYKVCDAGTARGLISDLLRKDLATLPAGTARKNAQLSAAVCEFLTARSQSSAL